jgi:ferredoxin
MNKIVFKPSKCNGCGICTTRAPHVWNFNSMVGKAELIDAEFKKDSYFRVLWPDEMKIMDEIVSICPTKAIQIL